jgi:hypothetical protein
MQVKEQKREERYKNVQLQKKKKVNVEAEKLYLSRFAEESKIMLCETSGMNEN